MSVNNSNNCNSNSADNADNPENACVVCFRDTFIYSIGECDHPVCYECSTRMRVLCQQNECPICRQGLAKVIFTNEKRTYRELEAKNRSEYYNKKYKICFYTIQIQKSFYTLLDHPCPICDSLVFSSFEALKAHVSREHELFYCNLCTEHLKIFSFERKCYNRQDLGIHRRKGDADNKSHRGHPSCEYCDVRYLDRDELFRHLRRDHFYCHFCDADGSNYFYSDYESLQEHFKDAHFVCEDRTCAEERFTSVFRSEIDLKAHISSVHGKSLDKKQAKQARTLQLEITLGPRPRAGQHDQNIANLRSRSNDESNKDEFAIPSQEARPKTMYARNEQDFPTLAGTSNASNLSLAPPTLSLLNKAGPSGLARTKENFPSLGGSGGVLASASNTRPKQQPVSAIIKKSSNPAQQTPSGGSMIIHVSNRPNSSIGGHPKKLPNKKDFPALPSSSKLSPFDDEGTYNSELNLNPLSAKHRSMVDDYVSVANPLTFQKIQLVQQEKEKEKKNAVLSEKNAPTLSNRNFPSLGSSNPVVQPSWVKPQKLKDLENKKSKVSPAPILPISQIKVKQKNGKTTQNVDVENNNKKDTNSLNMTGDSDNKPAGGGKQKQPKTKKVGNANENSKMLNGGNNNQNVKKSESKTNGSNLDFRAAPPPGFNGIGNTKPPPGFQSVTLNSIAKSPNNLTFTSSMGENFSILPSYQYKPPENCNQRNQELVTHFKNALSVQPAMDEFRHISQKFREGLYKPEAYYEHCQSALKGKFDDIFPELLALLPDISKQQELFLVHSQRLKNQQKSKLCQQQLNKLKVCSICKQVLTTSDLSEHKKKHDVDANFPSLNNISTHKIK